MRTSPRDNGGAPARHGVVQVSSYDRAKSALDTATQVASLASGIYNHGCRRVETSTSGDNEMRGSQIVRAARHYGSRAYDYARVAGGQLNNIVETSAHVYGGLVQRC